MNELHGLLPPPVAPPRLPLPGPDVIVDAARRRRHARARHAALTAGAGALTVAVAVAVVLHPASGAERLRPAHVPVPSMPPAASTVPKNAVARHGAPPATSPGKVHATPAASPTAAPSPTRSPVATITRTLVADSGDGCIHQYQAPALGVCTRADAPSLLRPGEKATFVFEVCADGRDTTLHYDGSAEITAEIRDTAKVTRWQSPSEAGGRAHDVVIPRDHCLRYAVPWPGTDAAGNALDRGDYTFTASVAGAGAMLAEDWAEDSFMVS